MPIRPFVVSVAALTAVCLTACPSSSGSPKPSATASAPKASSTSTSASSGPTAPASTSAATLPALARYPSLGGASTTMRFVPSFVRALYTRSITTAAAGDAHLSAVGRSSQIVLPITAGNATVYAGSAAVHSSVSARHGGSGLRLGNADGVTVRVDDFTVVLGKSAHITAQLATVVNGATGPSKPVVLFTVRTGSATKATRKGGVTTLTGLRLYLTSQARTALDAALATTALSTTGSSAIGTVTVSLSKG